MKQMRDSFRNLTEGRVNSLNINIPQDIKSNWEACKRKELFRK
jgi:hypothetical protein